MTRWMIGAALLGGIAFAASFLLDTGDVVERRYDTLRAAQADHAWLPQSLPISTYGIRTSNNVDLNTSEGEFAYAMKDDASLAARLAEFDATKHGPLAGGEDVVAMQADGYRVGVIVEPPSVWLIYCLQGVCRYRMSPERFLQ